MAQHIPIQNFSQKIFRDIERSINKDFEKGWKMLRTSMKYIYDDGDNYGLPNEEVFFTTRHIGKGFIYGHDRGDFEIHIDRDTNKIINIYLVA
jgi:hypothetical protein